MMIQVLRAPLKVAVKLSPLLFVSVFLEKGNPQRFFFSDIICYPSRLIPPDILLHTGRKEIFQRLQVEHGKFLFFLYLLFRISHGEICLVS